MMLVHAAAPFPASLARTRTGDCKVFLTHSFKPPFSEGGAGVGVSPPPPVSASTPVEMVIPIALSGDVDPCSQNSVRIGSVNVVSSFRIWWIVSRILLIWERRASRLAAATQALCNTVSSKFVNVFDLCDLSLFQRNVFIEFGQFGLHCGREWSALPCLTAGASGNLAGVRCTAYEASLAV